MNSQRVLQTLSSDDLIRRSDAGGWDVTNLGAILFSKRSEDFGPLRRKAVRVIHYGGSGWMNALKEGEDTKGYACGFLKV